ncbi:hypothetical protein [Candidatus Pelagibacter sp.]|uniref:hypothetical protein n=1 Tax=Candidatus Pelagibacter sp. TaxID=2024849 RepID=UPI003F8295F3
MIIAKLKWNTKLVEVDEFVQKFTKKNKKQKFDVDIKLTDTECLVLFSYTKKHN